MKIIRQWHIGDSIWQVRFKRSLGEHHGKTVWGECCPSDKVIYIRSGQNPRQRWLSFCHELLHAIECEARLNIPHLLVHKLEEPILDFLEKNIFGKKIKG